MTKPRLVKVRALFYVLQHAIQRGCAYFDTPSCIAIGYNARISLAAIFIPCAVEFVFFDEILIAPIGVAEVGSTQLPAVGLRFVRRQSCSFASRYYQLLYRMFAFELIISNFIIILNLYIT